MGYCFLKTGVFVTFISFFLVLFDTTQTSLALSFHSFELGLDLFQHGFNIRITSIQSACQIQSLHCTCNISILHQLLSFGAISCNLLATLQFCDLLLHAFQVRIAGLNSQTIFKCLDTVWKVIQGFLCSGQSVVSLDKILVCQDALATSFCHFFVFTQLFMASSHV